MALADIDPDPATPPRPAKRPTGKLAALLTAVATRHGVRLADLAATLGWAPHTTRAAICRLRQRGYAIETVPAAHGGPCRYRLPRAARTPRP